MPLSEYVYCVAITFKMTEWVEQQICIKCCFKLVHSSVETTQMIQKAAAMGNWWSAASSRQCTRSCNMSHTVFCKISNHSDDSAPYSPDLVSCDFWLFPKLKSPLKGKRFQTIDEIQENTMGQLMAIERTVWGPKVPTWKGTKAPVSYIPCLLYLVSSLINVSIFHITWLVTFWTDLVYVGLIRPGILDLFLIL